MKTTTGAGVLTQMALARCTRLVKVRSATRHAQTRCTQQQDRSGAAYAACAGEKRHTAVGRPQCDVQTLAQMSCELRRARDVRLGRGEVRREE